MSQITTQQRGSDVQIDASNKNLVLRTGDEPDSGKLLDADVETVGDIPETLLGDLWQVIWVDITNPK